MPYTVDTRPRARRDISNEADYLRTRSRAAERKWFLLVDRVLAKLAFDPQQFPEAPEAAELGVDLRELTVGKRRRTGCRFLFLIEGGRVRLVRVRLAAQDRLSERDL